MWLWAAVVGVVVTLLFWYKSTLKAPPKLSHKRPPEVSPPLPLNKTGLQYLIIGGGGFLGSFLVEALLERGESHVRVFDCQAAPRFNRKKYQKQFPPQGFEYVRGNIMNQEELLQACKGVDVVFHMASVIHYWARLKIQRTASYNINVIGTQNVIEACKKAGVKQLIYTSSVTVAMNYGKPIRFGDETMPYSTKPPNWYTETKAIAEQLVVAANGKAGLYTVVVRPAPVFGPFDKTQADLFWEQKGELPVRSDGLQDFIHVDNAVYAHLLAHHRLLNETMETDTETETETAATSLLVSERKEEVHVAGQVYIVTNGEPITLVEHNKRFAKAFGFHLRTTTQNKWWSFLVPQKFKEISVPFWLLWSLAYTVELLTWLSGDSAWLRSKVLGPQLAVLTPPAVWMVSTDLCYCIDKAKNELGYRPIISMDEAYAKTAKFYLREKKQTSKQKKI